MPILIYIDDVLVGGANKAVCESNTALTLSVLEKAGWVVSPSKVEGPAPRITFLGLVICGQSLRFFIPEGKIQKLMDVLSETIRARRRTARVVIELWVQ